VTWQIPTLKLAQRQEHLEVSSNWKGTCYFPQKPQEVYKLYSRFKNRKQCKLSIPDLLLGTHYQALASFMKFNTLYIQ